MLILPNIFAPGFNLFHEIIFVYFNQHCHVNVIFCNIIKHDFDFACGGIKFVLSFKKLIYLLLFFIFKCKVFNFVICKFDFFSQNILWFCNMFIPQNYIFDVEMFIKVEQIIETFDCFAENQVHYYVWELVGNFVQLVKDFRHVLIIFEFLKFVQFVTPVHLW